MMMVMMIIMMTTTMTTIVKLGKEFGKVNRCAISMADEGD